MQIKDTNTRGSSNLNDLDISHLIQESGTPRISPITAQYVSQNILPSISPRLLRVSIHAPLPISASLSVSSVSFLGRTKGLEATLSNALLLSVRYSEEFGAPATFALTTSLLIRQTRRNVEVGVQAHEIDHLLSLIRTSSVCSAREARDV